MVAEKNG